MKPEDIVVSLEHAKALKKAGWPQKHGSYFWYDWDGKLRIGGKETLSKGCIYPETVVIVPSNDDKIMKADEWNKKVCAAPTAEELLRKLPPSIRVGEDTWYLVISDDRDWVGDESWDVLYSPDRSWNNTLHVRGKGGFAEACAKMYCLLAEHKLL